jgi:heme A synthase
MTQVALPLAALHQICALGLFGAALWWAYALKAAPGSYSAGIAR